MPIFAHHIIYKAKTMATKSILRIREICKEKGMTQADLASRLGIRRDSLSQAISRNNFDLAYLQRIANALEVDVSILFHDDRPRCPHCGKLLDITIDSGEK